MQRVIKEIPKFLIASTADVWYDFQEATNYYIFDREKNMELVKVVRIDTQDDAMIIYEDYYCCEKFLVLEEIWHCSGLYEIIEDEKAVLRQEARRNELDKENRQMVVYSCSECKSSGAGRDFKINPGDEIPEVSEMECPICEKLTLVLDREASVRVYSNYIPNEMDKKALILQEFANRVSESEIHFVCNDCLVKNGEPFPPTWYYHDTGRCEQCKQVTDVSVPSLNKKAAELGLIINADTVANFETGRNIIWTSRIYDLKGKGFPVVTQSSN